MSPDKKQRQQLLVLGILVVAFVGFLSFQVTRTKSAAPQQATAKATAAKTSDEAGDTEAAEASTVSLAPEMGPAPVRRDPFLPQKLPSDPTTVATAAPPARAPKPVSFPSPQPLPKINIPPINPFGGKVDVAPVPTIAVDEEPRYTLTGVIRGSQNVAILRSAEGSRHIVKQGQMIDGRYKVLAVNSDGVVLAHNNRRFHVRLGGVKNAS